MNNIITLITAQFATVRSALFARAGSVDSILSDARNLRARCAVLVEAKYDRADVLENEIAEREAQIEQLDVEADEVRLVQVGLSRLLGE